MGSRTERARGVMVGCCLALAAVAIVRAGQGDTQKPDFSGKWALDRNISSDTSQIEFVPAANANRRPQRGGIGGIGGGGFGRGTRRRTGGDSAESLTPTEEERLKALTAQLKTATAT